MKFPVVVVRKQRGSLARPEVLVIVAKNGVAVEGFAFPAPGRFVMLLLINGCRWREHNVYRKQRKSGDVVEVLDLPALFDPFKADVAGRFHTRSGAAGAAGLRQVRSGLPVG